MLKTFGESFIESVKQKEFLVELLPIQPLIVRMEGKEVVTLYISKDEQKLIAEANQADVQITGEALDLEEIFYATLPLRKWMKHSSVKCEGAFRHLLLLESLFVLCKNKKIQQKKG
ncbi:hypothetical protein Q73_12260 [Bacillus coahuilensis m2-6]|uniref:hypothetical protein n=1 Tax=Bacillus coahuilensis TaxID=408580 RepID=UPI000750515A|nr:hypothetical protein [Bacillus coahuilensis]KUP05797.1 hypothetical protein Q73_12260 [Bacillus coahuilensis m2-6]